MNSMGNPSANMAANPQNNATGYNNNNQPPMNGQSMPPNAGNNGGPNPPTSGNQPQEGTVEYILKQAAENGDKTAVINMLERGAPFVVDMDGQTVLHLAAMHGHLDTVTALLDRGCDPNIQDFCGHTGLQRAAAAGHIDIVKLLLDSGALVDHQDELYGNTALHEAAWKGYSQTVNLLCKRRGNVYLKNRGGFTPLHLACQTGHNQSSRNILITGCKPDIKNDYGDTPIHTAARYGHAGVIRILVSANCKVSEQNKNGDTALHIASAMNRRKLTRILLEIGVNREIRNKQGETALDIAMRKNLTEIIDIFQSIAVQPKNLIVENHRQHAAGGDKQRMNTSSSANNSFDFTPPLPPSSAAAKAPQIGGEYLRETWDEIKKLSDSRISKDKLVYNNNNGDSRRSKRSSEFSGGNGKSTSAGKDSKKSGKKHAEGCRTNIPHLGGGSKSRANNNGDKHGNSGGQCDCLPVIEMLGRRIEADRAEILTSLAERNKVLDTRLTQLESKTRRQIASFNQTMKECFAEERGECQTRMDRLALKERIEMERQQAIRDIVLKRDIARWLQAKMLEIEKSLGSTPENKAIIKKLQRRKSRRETKSLLSEVRNGTLRRTNSDEHLTDIDTTNAGGRHNETGLPSLPSMAGNSGDFYGDKYDPFSAVGGVNPSWKDNGGRPRAIYAADGGNNLLEPLNRREPVKTRRIRHNSEGNYDDVNFVTEALFTATPTVAKLSPEENIYENLLPLYSASEMNNNNHNGGVTTKNLSAENSKFALKKMHSGGGGSTPKKSGGSRHLNIGIITPPLSSDTSSLDSHNDSGYSTRMGVSDGPSPLMCDTEPMLDPKAVFMIPKDVVANSPFVKAMNGGSSAGFNSDDVLINKKSSFV